MGAPGGYGYCMKAPTPVFARETEGQPELVVNFGVFSGREVTDAEVYRLAAVLLEEVDSVEIVCERRYEFDGGSEATVYVVRVELPHEIDSDSGTSAPWLRAGRATASPSGATSLPVLVPGNTRLSNDADQIDRQRLSARSRGSQSMTYATVTRLTSLWSDRFDNR